MAAVTNVAYTPTVMGNKRVVYAEITGNSGDTLTVGLLKVNRVNHGPVITSVAIAAGTVPGTSVLTLTTGGSAFTGERIEVIGN